MVKKIKLKNVAVYENVLEEFYVGHCGIKVKVAIALEKFIISL